MHPYRVEVVVLVPIDNVCMTLPAIVVTRYTTKTFLRVHPACSKTWSISTSSLGDMKNLDYLFKFETNLEIAYHCCPFIDKKYQWGKLFRENVKIVHQLTHVICDRQGEAGTS